MFFCYSLTESSKSPASIARSNKQLPGYERSQGGTRLRNLVRRDPFTESRKEGSVYGRIPYEPGFLMILQVAKRIANVRFTQRMLLLRSSRTHVGLLFFFFLRIHAHKEVCKNCTGNIMPYTKYCTRDRCKRICCKMRGCK